MHACMIVRREPTYPIHQHTLSHTQTHHLNTLGAPLERGGDLPPRVPRHGGGLLQPVAHHGRVVRDIVYGMSTHICICRDGRLHLSIWIDPSTNGTYFNSTRMVRGYSMGPSCINLDLCTSHFAFNTCIRTCAFGMSVYIFQSRPHPTNTVPFIDSTQ